MRYMPRCLFLCLALSGCVVNRDRFSFVEYSRDPTKYGAPTTTTAWQPSDQQALAFSSNVAKIFRAKCAGSRVTREVSGSTQVAMAGLAGTSAAFNFSKSGLAVLGLGSSLIPSFQNIFNAKGRAESYADAVRLIETAQNDYLAHNQKPSKDELTQNGVTLIQRTQATIHILEKTLASRLPSIIELQQATEAMSKKGATKTPAGEAYNHIGATGELPTLRQPVAPGAGVPKPQPAQSDDALVKQAEIQSSIDKLTTDVLPPTTIDVMNRLDPPTTSPEGLQITKYPRTKTGLRKLVGKTSKTDDLDSIKATLP
jgi:hypothetical protein